MATTNYNIRIEQELRDRAFSVFERYGLAPSQAIKLFLNQVADTHHAGRRENIPNAVTRQALEEARAEQEHPTAPRYTLEEAMQVMREIAGE